MERRSAVLAGTETADNRAKVGPPTIEQFLWLNALAVHNAVNKI